MKKTEILKSLNCLIIALFVGVIPSLSATTFDWTVKKSKDKITLYTARDEHHQRWVKAETNVEAPWWSLLNLLRETNKGVEWIDNAIEVKILEQPDEYTDVVRTRFSAPLWFRNREMLTQSKVTFDYKKRVLTIAVRQKPQSAVSDGYIQMENIEGIWEVHQVNEHMSQITWTGTGVAGGSIPDWLAASVMTGSTFRTFQALRTRLPQEKYHHKPLGYIPSSKNPQN